MKRKKFIISACCCLSALALSLTGCAGKDKTAGKKGKPESQREIAYLTFLLPNQIKWERNPDEKLNSMNIAEWYVAGTTSATSPIRIIYQKLEPAKPVVSLREEVQGPFSVCKDKKMSEFKGQSVYSDQINIETICSKLGENPFGLISYVSIFSDSVANHVVIAESKTPPSQKAGVLDFKDAENKKQAETAKTLADLAIGLMQSIRACDEKKLCI